MPGTFIVFEGPEGAGKTTQVERLAATLRDDGYTVRTTREPGGTPVAEAIRDLVLRAGGEVGYGILPSVEALLFTAARADHVARVIVPALERGEIVLCDRFVGSTIAYQGGGRGIDIDDLLAAQRLATGGIRPDLTILLDVPVEIGLRRRWADTSSDGAPNRLDAESRSFHERVRETYLRLAGEAPRDWTVIDARTTPEEIAVSVLRSARGVLPPRAGEGHKPATAARHVS